MYALCFSITPRDQQPARHGRCLGPEELAARRVGHSRHILFKHRMYPTSTHQMQNGNTWAEHVTTVAPSAASRPADDGLADVNGNTLPVTSLPPAVQCVPTHLPTLLAGTSRHMNSGSVRKAVGKGIAES
eukprot:gene5987-biopygen16331